MGLWVKVDGLIAYQNDPAWTAIEIGHFVSLAPSVVFRRVPTVKLKFWAKPIFQFISLKKMASGMVGLRID